MVKRIALLGSTGSIGTQTLEVVDSLRRGDADIRVTALGANSNIDLLERQARSFAPELVAVGDALRARELKQRLSDTKTEVLTGPEGLLEAAAMDGADTVVNALVGKVGLRPTLAAIKAGKQVALANKETLVMAGELVMKELAAANGSLYPIDSEHTAIWQCLSGNAGNAVERILLTASGGPFRGRKLSELEHVTVAEALAHPNWSMGAKITIDSATLINKGFEVIECKWLYGVGLEKIEVLVHPQSIIHSMVEFEDGAVMAQLSANDMRIPIQYALTGSRRAKNTFPRLDFLKLAAFTFEAPDTDNFPCLRLAYDALRAGGTLAAVLNCANDLAVCLFLNGKIGFNAIASLIEDAMSSYTVIHDYTFQDIVDAENWAADFFRRKGAV